MKTIVGDKESSFELLEMTFDQLCTKKVRVIVYSAELLHLGGAAEQFITSC